MDFVKIKTRMIEIFNKYKYVWIVLLAGMILMMLPAEKEIKDQSTLKQPITVEEESTQKQMESILSQIALIIKSLVILVKLLSQERI